MTRREQRNLLVSQVIQSAQRVPTSPEDYRKALKRIIQMNPKLTHKELADKLGRTEKWLEDMLREPQPCE